MKYDNSCTVINLWRMIGAVVVAFLPLMECSAEDRSICATLDVSKTFPPQISISKITQVAKTRSPIASQKTFQIIGVASGVCLERVEILAQERVITSANLTPKLKNGRNPFFVTANFVGTPIPTHCLARVVTANGLTAESADTAIQSVDAKNNQDNFPGKISPERFTADPSKAQ